MSDSPVRSDDVLDCPRVSLHQQAYGGEGGEAKLEAALLLGRKLAEKTRRNARVDIYLNRRRFTV